MAEPEKKQDKQEKQQKSQDKQQQSQEKKKRPEPEITEHLVRILGYDIPGSKSIFTGLTRIKGVSWSVANAVCIKLPLDKRKKVAELSKPEIQKIESFLKEMPISDYLKNRRKDIESGETKHFLTSDLDIKREFDIKRLKEIKSYRGLRHSLRLPVRGQRTRSHFRNKGAAMGVKRKAK